MSARTRRRPASRTLVGAVVAAAVLGATSADAHAPSSVTSFYVWANSTCTSKAEPITIVFTGFANATRAANHVQKHTVWAVTSGNTRYLKGHFTNPSCRLQNWQRSAGLAGDRWHMRGRTIHALSSTDVTTLASAHRESIKACGHVVKPAAGGVPSGFDQGREKLYEKFGGAAGIVGHPPASVNWGNSTNFQQCDGSYAGANGKVYSIGVPNALHALP
jgi:hypothetical protein